MNWRHTVLVLVFVTTGVGRMVQAQVATDAPSSTAPQLQAIGWLLGEWTAQGENSVVLVSSRYSDEGHYIVREFLVRRKDGDEVGGTQRIGWDPVQNRIKSWSFDSRGNSGEGYWRHEGDRWIVESNEILEDGQTVRSTAIYTPQGAESFAWESKCSPLAGVPLQTQHLQFARATGQLDFTSVPVASNSANAQGESRRAIMESDRWRQTIRGMNNWLSTQRLYTADEVAAIRADMEKKIETMSPSKLKDFLDDMEERLAVLTSPEAEEARLWVSQFLATARNAEEQIQRRRPDIINMTAGEIRLELHRFQHERAQRQQSQAASGRARAQQMQSAQSLQAARRQSQAQARNARSQAAANVPRGSQKGVPRDQRTGHTDASTIRTSSPHYTISPWGTPIRWDPFHIDNR